MDKGIPVFWGYLGEGYDWKSKLKKNKKAGFQRIITTADKRFDYQNGTIDQQVKYAKKLGLKLSSLHCTYDDSKLHYFWEDCKEGKNVEKIFKNDIKLCAKYGFTCLVVHLMGVTNEIGLQRIRRLLDFAKKKNVLFAVENLVDPKMIKYVFDNIDHPNLKMCYDTGHNNFADKQIKYLELYADKVITLHIHDNNGEKDEHTLMKYGTIDWNRIAKQLAKTNIEILDFELLARNLPSIMDGEEALKQAYNELCELEKKILRYKEQKNIVTKNKA